MMAQVVTGSVAAGSKKRIQRWAGWVLQGACALSVSPLLTHCQWSTNCTAIGCSNGVNIVVNADRWPTGTYSLVVTEPKLTTTCQVSLGPGALGTGGQPSQGVTVAGSDPSGVEIACEQSSGAEVVDWKLAQVQFFGNLQVWIQDTPETVGLELRFADVALLDEQFTPSYQRHSPNGPECGPVCRQASAEFDLSPITPD